MMNAKMMASGGMTKKGYAAGGMTKKGYAAGGAAMPMKDGKPAFIGDGKGAMAKGGAVQKKMMATGGVAMKAKMKASGGAMPKAKKK